MATKEDLTHEIDFDLTDIPKSKQREAKKAAGEFILNEMFLSIERGFSPVQGEGKFKNLTKDYAENQKGGRRTANLNLEGDMLSALTFKQTDEGIKILINRSAEVDKADGHNQITADAKVWAAEKDFPRRRFIPNDNEGQTLTGKIMRGAKKVLDNFRAPPATTPTSEDIFAEDTGVSPEVETSTLISSGPFDLFGDAAIEAVILDELAKRRG